MTKPNSQSAYQEYLTRSEAVERKKAAAARGKILPKRPIDREQAKFDSLLRWVREHGDEIALKR